MRQKEPQSAEAYRSLALSYNRTKDFTKVREQIVQGLESCPDDPELMQLFSRVLQIDGRAWEAWQEMSLRAKQHPDQPVWWLMAIDAAVAANRRDLALEACQEMRKVSPTNRLVTRVEARLWLDAGNAHQAAQLLNTLNLADLARDPEAVQLYVRALADAPFRTLCVAISTYKAFGLRIFLRQPAGRSAFAMRGAEPRALFRRFPVG